MWQSQSAASARGQPFFACEMLRHHASCGRCHRAAPAATSAMRRAVDGAAPPLFLQVPGPRGAEEVARAHATATQTPCTPGYVETGRRWCPSRWSRRLVAVPDSSCLQRSSPGRCWSRRRSSLVRVVFDVAASRLGLGRRDADGGRTRNCWAHLALRLDLHTGPGIRSRRHRRDVPPTRAPRTSNSSSPSPRWRATIYTVASRHGSTIRCEPRT